MGKRAIVRLLLIFTGIVALTMSFPLILALAEGEAVMVRAFILSMAPPLFVAALAAILGRKTTFRISAADGFLLAFLAWVLSCLAGALPYYISGSVPRFWDAVFESVSGFSTTGATIIVDVEIMPRSLLLWRAMTHWLGGMGIVVLTVAILPLLGVGGFQLVKAETTGPEKEKFTPKITASAKILWLIYLSLTVVQTLLLFLGGMSLFDAVIHAFSTMATGGFSSRNNSIAAYNSPYIEWVCIVFMILAGFNFTLFYQLLRGKWQHLCCNSEAKAYFFIISVSVIIIGFALAGAGTPVSQAVRYAFFQAASIMTTTGFSVADHNLWPHTAQLVLLCLMLTGGCSGSTSGGIKVIRLVVLFKQAKNEAKRLIYPQGVFNIRLNDKVGRKDVVYGVAGFIFVYGALILAGAFALAAGGEDIYTALNASVAALGNIGLGMGELITGEVYIRAPAWVKGILSLTMIAGRLELWAFFVLLTPEYWRR